ncbi:MAG TPA: HNH endonuclease [Phycisphaerae bacterium]|jgi:putative restriction endonuclease|nr:HNH endonuclease [Phycisphaerae bacterium]HOJ56216.1 HNH endonuclease [Phycisphaerae bacterium]HOL28058.1 HNH endonuclease [Phycisphaerae bacterium]HPP22417.1 HNH endonuclease [Phycisphaerae bacterium]HPU34605.1 HNH endonuclease [Phycisphaerae bacterium]
MNGTGFRRLVRGLYQDSCSVCGLHLVAVTGHSICEAAHVIPFELSSNDDPRNGLGLCPVHHWCFDEGLFTVTPEYRVKVSPVLDSTRPTEDRLVEFDSTVIRLPDRVEYRPAREALEWHQRHKLLIA